MDLQKTEDITVTKTYTITLEQVRKLDILEPIMGMKKSELVRVAIDRLFDQHLKGAG